jgi:uncharacterized membrane protein YccC
LLFKINANTPGTLVNSNFKQKAAMTSTQHYQLRQETLTFLARAAKPKRGTNLMPQVDALIDELEHAWQHHSLEQLQRINEKAKALAELAELP